MFRLIGRLIKYLFLLLVAVMAIPIVVALVLWVAALIHGDEVLNPEIAAFYHVDPQTYLVDNAMVAIAGFSAPASTQNSYEWALSHIGKNAAAMNAGNAAATTQSGYLQLQKYLQQTDLGAGLQQELDAIPDRVQFLGDTRGLSCWIGTPQSGQPCLNKDAVLKLIRDNSVLLARHNELSRYEHFIAPPQGVLANAELFIRMQELYLAYLVIESETNSEAALARWLTNNAMIRRGLSDQNGLIPRSVLLVTYQASQHVLPVLLGVTDPVLLEKYKPALDQALKTFGPREMNLSLAMKAEYQILKPFIDQLDNTNRNKIYEFNKDFIALADLPAVRYPAANADFHMRYEALLHSRDWHSLPLGIVTNLIIRGLSVASDLIGAMHAMDARNRMLALHVEILSQRIPAEQVAAFITNAPRELQDPFTQKPFAYDPKTQTIHFTHPGAESAKHTIPVRIAQ